MFSIIGLKSLLILIFVATNSAWIDDLYPEIHEIPLDDTIDYGKPLHLTPYINEGRIIEAQNLSRVRLDKFKEIRSYSGFITVNEASDSNLFFWFFEAIDRNVNDAPIIIWLQGGPGSSGMYGLFTEIGPLMFDISGNLERRVITWNMEYSLLFVDSPVGTGYSYTRDGYASDVIQITEELHTALIQFFKLFPNLVKNDFFIFGESYAGKYAPALAYTIMKHNTSINLRGIGIGNPYSDPIHQIEYGSYLYELGLIDDSQRKLTEQLQDEVKRSIRAEDWPNATKSFMKFADVFTNFTHLHCFYNYLQEATYIDGHWSEYVQKPDFRKMIHVGNARLHNGTEVKQHMKLDQCKSVVPLITTVLDHYPLMLYSGEVDIIVAYPFTVNFLKKMSFTGSENYQSAERIPWYCFDGFKNTLCGYRKKAGNLVDVLVRKAGHMVPYDQPFMALDMLRNFINDILRKK